MNSETPTAAQPIDGQSMLTTTSLSLLTLMLLFIQIAFTWPLWNNSHNYPLIPLIGLKFLIPAYGDMFSLIILGCTATSLVIENISRMAGKLSSRKLQNDNLTQTSADVQHTGQLAINRFQILWFILCVSLGFLILTNQHRLQAWAWQIFLYGICFSAFRPANSLKWIRRVTISIYFYSAISKLDASFLQTHGQVLLDGTLKLLPIEIDLSESMRTVIVGLFPLVEFLIALLLCFRFSRRWGWRLSLVLHFGLILILGPFGLNHHLPVLIWNAFFLMQNSILFASVNFQPDNTRDDRDQYKRRREYLGRIAIVAALLFPATEWFNLCDVWPGWGLYASRGAKVQLYIEREALKNLPPEVAQHCFTTVAYPDHVRLDLFRWSFAETHAPAYPEDRFLTAVALATLQNYGIKDRFLYIHSSTAHRWTGEREQIEFSNLKALQRFTSGFLLNTQQVKSEVAENLRD
ncbi:MAG TPA: hypothetical protein DD473_19145 [Planctomycetaceae bacterium]|nr:hypothetical protein [Planctomycetaceae bacterium]